MLIRKAYANHSGDSRGSGGNMRETTNRGVRGNLRRQVNSTRGVTGNTRSQAPTANRRRNAVRGNM